MSEGEGQSPETQAEEASKDANVTIDEPTAPALDLSPDPNTEWEKAGAEASEGGREDAKTNDNNDDDDEKDEDGADEASEPEGDGSTTADTSDDTDDDSGQS
jgi:hypothetical protein